MKISLSRIHFPVTTLGPGRRLGIWFQGCSIRCPGCISTDTWVKSRPNTTVHEILDSATPWLEQCDGITISGGEPFDQTEALKLLILEIRKKISTNILVYSGKPLKLLLSDPIVSTGMIDCLISEPFELNSPNTKWLMGSDNQQMTFLTPLGRQIFAPMDRLANEADRRLDIMFDERGTAWLAGIPRRGDLRILQQILRSEGTSVGTTEAKE